MGLGACVIFLMTFSVHIIQLQASWVNASDDVLRYPSRGDVKDASRDLRHVELTGIEAESGVERLLRAVPSEKQRSIIGRREFQSYIRTKRSDDDGKKGGDKAPTNDRRPSKDDNNDRPQPKADSSARTGKAPVPLSNKSPSEDTTRDKTRNEDTTRDKTRNEDTTRNKTRNEDTTRDKTRNEDTTRDKTRNEDTTRDKTRNEDISRKKEQPEVNKPPGGKTAPKRGDNTGRACVDASMGKAPTEDDSETPMKASKRTPCVKTTQQTPTTEGAATIDPDIFFNFELSPLAPFSASPAGSYSQRSLPTGRANATGIRKLIGASKPAYVNQSTPGNQSTPKLVSGNQSTPRLNIVNLTTVNQRTPKLNIVNLTTVNQSTPRLNIVNLTIVNQRTPKLNIVNLTRFNQSTPKLASGNQSTPKLNTVIQSSPKISRFPNTRV